LLALVVALIAGVTLYRQFRVPDAPAASAAVTDSPGRRTGARHLSAEEMRALARRSPGATGPATAQDMAEMMRKRARLAEASQTRIQQRNADMAGRFSAERPDPAWSGAHEKDLASLQDSGPMRDAGAKVANFQAECRSSMCRIQGDFPDSGMATDWLQLFRASVGDRLPVATAHQIRNPDGSVRVEIYGLGRK
jgi:hypothetical protein